MKAVIQNNNFLEKISSTIGELPASPAIVSAVMGLTADLNSSVEDLGAVLAADASMTAKVLKISNSSFYGRSRSVSSLKEAILILGFYTLRSMVIASSAHNIFGRKDNAVFGQKLWDHSLACGMASRLIARQMQHPKIEEIFIVGLLHDIGKIVLGQKLMSAYDNVVKDSESSGRSFLEIEQEALGFTHVDVGATVLDKWNFPMEIVEGVRMHHRCEDIRSEEWKSIGSVVNFTNQLAKRLDIGFKGGPEYNLLSHPVARGLELDESALHSVVDELQQKFSEEKHLFEDN